MSVAARPRARLCAKRRMRVRISRSKIDKLACQAQSEDIFAKGENPAFYILYQEHPLRMLFLFVCSVSARTRSAVLRRLDFTGVLTLFIFVLEYYLKIKICFDHIADHNGTDYTIITTNSLLNFLYNPGSNSLDTKLCAIFSTDYDRLHRIIFRAKINCIVMVL